MTTMPSCFVSDELRGRMLSVLSFASSDIDLLPSPCGPWIVIVARVRVSPSSSRYGCPPPDWLLNPVLCVALLMLRKVLRILSKKLLNSGFKAGSDEAIIPTFNSTRDHRAYESWINVVLVGVWSVKC